MAAFRCPSLSTPPPTDLHRPSYCEVLRIQGYQALCRFTAHPSIEALAKCSKSCIMAPGQGNGDVQRTKRRRVANDNGGHLADILNIQNSQLDGDALSSLVVQSALDSLLEKQRLSATTKKKIETVLREVKSALDTLPKKAKKMEVDSAILRNTLRKVAKGSSLNSLFRSLDYENLSLKCCPPTKVNVVGSFLLGYASEPVVDVAVEMPASLFQSKDFLNYRYHDRRFMYLIYLARHFLKAEEDKWSNVSVIRDFLNDDHSKPLLSLSLADHPKIRICIIPTYPSETFEGERLNDNRRNLRPSGESSLVENVSEGTTAYNNGILMDSVVVANLQSLYSVAKSVPSFTDTVLLLRTWCGRHRLLKSKFVLAALVADVVQQGIAPQRASREHLLRCTLNAIRNGLLTNIKLNGVRLCAGNDLAMLERMKSCAATALRIIESQAATEDPWHGILPYLFSAARGSKLVARPLSTLFDGFLRISSGNGVDLPNEEEMKRVLQRAFVETGRVTHIEQLDTSLFGLTLSSSEDSCRKVDTRPKSCEASSFLSFWGSKAELRRFKDGTIIESLVWMGGLETLNEIASYVVQKHFGNNITVDVILADVELAAGVSASDMSASKAIATFDELATLLRSAEGLPLSILAVQAASPYLRHCGAYPIRASPSNRFIQPLDIVASFETSSAWPNAPVAISAAKAAFYVALKSTLAKSGLHSKASISFLDITLAGFVFRLRLRVDKEKTLLPAESEDVSNLIWETETRVQHHHKIRHVGNPLMGSVARLAKRWLSAHLLLSQMGSRAEELVEILVASIFSDKRTTPPKSTMSCFCQFLHLLAEFPWEVCPLSVFLRDDDDTPSRGGDDQDIDEYNDSDYKQFLQSSQARFSEKLDGPPSLSVYCAWNENQSDVETWFPKGHSPQKVIADRICATARSSLSFIEDYILKPTEGMSLGTVFSTPVEVFDAILELNEAYVPFGSKKGIFRTKGSSARLDSLLVGFDPVQILKDKLTECLGDFAMFLMENCGRPQIFVVWRPEASARVKFSLRNAPYMTPVESDGKLLEPCKEHMLCEMRRIGDGFIDNISFPKKKGGQA